MTLDIMQRPFNLNFFTCHASRHWLPTFYTISVTLTLIGDHKVIAEHFSDLDLDQGSQGHCRALFPCWSCSARDYSIVSLLVMLS